MSGSSRGTFGQLLRTPYTRSSQPGIIGFLCIALAARCRDVRKKTGGTGPGRGVSFENNPMDEIRGEGPGPSSEGNPDPHERSRCAGHGVGVALASGMPAPPGVTMDAPPGAPRNASRAKREGRAGSGVRKARPKGHYRGRSPKAPSPPCCEGPVRIYGGGTKPGRTMHFRS